VVAEDDLTPEPIKIPDVNPARYWRDALAAYYLRANPPPPGTDPDDHFCSLVDTTFTDARRGLQSRHPKNRAAASVAVYVSGLALLTYGRLDVLPFVLKHVPPESSPLRALVSSVSSLVPLPPWLSPRTDPSAVAVWLEAHGEDLCWSEEDGRFIMTGVSGPIR
jgi:hypothetical protein